MKRFAIACLVIFSTSVFGLQIDPQYEGVYKINLTCQTSDKHCQKQSFLKDANFVVMNDTSGKSAIATINRRDYNIEIYRFQVRSITNGGQVMKGDSFEMGGRLAEFYADLDLRSRTIKVFIRDPEFDNDYVGTGTQVLSVGSLMTATSFQQNEIIGDYRVTRGKYGGILRIRKTSSPNYPLVASYRVIGVNVHVHFPIVKLDQNRGLMRLYKIDSDGSQYSWTMSVNRGSDGLFFGEGFTINTDGGGNSMLKYAKTN